MTKWCVKVRQSGVTKLCVKDGVWKMACDGV